MLRIFGLRRSRIIRNATGFESTVENAKKQLHHHYMLSKHFSELIANEIIINPDVLSSMHLDFNSYRRSLIFSDQIKEEYFIQKFQNMSLEHKLIVSKSGYARLFDKNPDLYTLYLDELGRAAKESKDVLLETDVEIQRLLQNKSLNHLQTILRALKDKKVLREGHLQGYASRLITAYATNDQIEEAKLTKEYFHVPDAKCRSPFAAYYVRSGMFGNVRLIEEEQRADKITRPQYCQFLLSIFAEAARRNDASEMSRTLADFENGFVQPHHCSTLFRLCQAHNVHHSIKQRIVEIFAQKLRTMRMLQFLAADDVSSVTPSMILQLGLDNMNESSEDFNSLYNWAYNLLKNSESEQGRNIHRILSQSFDAYFIQEKNKNSVEMANYVPSLIYRMNKRMDAESDKLNILLDRYKHDLSNLKELRQGDKSLQFLDKIRFDNDDVWQPLRNYLSTISPESLKQKLVSKNIDVDIIHGLQNMLDLDNIENIGGAFLNNVLQMPLENAPSKQLITEIANGFIDYTRNREHKNLSFTHSTQLSLLIRKLFKNGHRNSVVEILSLILEIADSKQMVVDYEIYLIFQYLPVELIDIQKAYANEKCNNLLEVKIPHDFPNDDEIVIFKNSKLSKSSLDAMQWRNYKMCVEKMESSPTEVARFLAEYGKLLNNINQKQSNQKFILPLSDERISMIVQNHSIEQKRQLFLENVDFFKVAASQTYAIKLFLDYMEELISTGGLEYVGSVFNSLQKYMWNSYQSDGVSTPKYRNGINTENCFRQPGNLQILNKNKSTTFEEYVFSDESQMLIEMFLLNQLVENNLSVADMQKMVGIFSNKLSLRRYCFALMCLAEDENAQQELIGWFRSLGAKENIENPYRKVYSVSFDPDESLELFSLITKQHKTGFARRYLQQIMKNNVHKGVGSEMFIGHLCNGSIDVASQMIIPMSKEIHEYSESISMYKPLPRHVTTHMTSKQLYGHLSLLTSSRRLFSDAHDEYISKYVTTAAGLTDSTEVSFFSTLKGHLKAYVDFRRYDKYDELLKLAVNSGFRPLPQDMRYIERLRRTVESKKIIDEYKKSQFLDHKLSHKLFEILFSENQGRLFLSQRDMQTVHEIVTGIFLESDQLRKSITTNFVFVQNALGEKFVFALGFYQQSLPKIADEVPASTIIYELEKLKANKPEYIDLILATLKQKMVKQNKFEKIATIFYSKNKAPLQTLIRAGSK